MGANDKLLKVMDKINAYLASKYKTDVPFDNVEEETTVPVAADKVIEKVMPQVNSTAIRYFFLRSLGNVLEMPVRRAKQGDGYPLELGIAIGEFDNAIQNLMNMLENGEITPEEWQEQFNGLIAYFMVMGYTLGNGELPDESARREISDSVAAQLTFLGAFGALVKLAADNGTLKYKMAEFRRRASMYATAMVKPYWRGKTIGLPLPALPGDLSSQCGQNCKCGWEIEWIDYTNGDADAYWTLQPAEHCQTCKERAARWNPLRIRNRQLILPDVTLMELVKEITHKHLPGRHDQKTHGSWATKFEEHDKVIETTQFKPIDKKYLDKSGMPTNDGVKEYFKDNPDGMLVFRADTRYYPSKIPHSREIKGERTYFLLHKDITGNDSTYWRVTMLTSGQEPLAHYSSKNIDHVMAYMYSLYSEIMEGSIYSNYSIFSFLGTTKELSLKGGAGSGNFGHAGRPGKVGGSAPRAENAGVIGKTLLDILERDERTSGGACDVMAQSLIGKLSDGKITDLSLVKSGSLADSIKANLVARLSQLSGVDYNDVNNIIHQWAISSNDEDVNSIMIQRVAAEVFGLQLSDWQKEEILRLKGSEDMARMIDNTAKSLVNDDVLENKVLEYVKTIQGDYGNYLTPSQVRNFKVYEQEGIEYYLSILRKNGTFHSLCRPRDYIDFLKLTYSRHPEAILAITHRYGVEQTLSQSKELLSEMFFTIEKEYDTITKNDLTQDNLVGVLNNFFEKKLGGSNYHRMGLDLIEVVNTALSSEYKKFEKFKFYLSYDPHNKNLLDETKIKKVLQTIYADTQETFRRAGYSPDDLIFLYRAGMPNRKRNLPRVKDICLHRGNALESFSTSRSTADSFRRKGRYVILSAVKVKNILCSFLNGFGCSYELEFVVMNRHNDVLCVVAGKN